MVGYAVLQGGKKVEVAEELGISARTELEARERGTSAGFCRVEIGRPFAGESLFQCPGTLIGQHFVLPRHQAIINYLPFESCRYQDQDDVSCRKRNIV